MRAVLINPFEEKVEVLEDFPGGLDAIYKALDCDCIDARSLDDDISIYVDDEGLFREGQRFFRLDGSEAVWSGKALVVGIDGEGDDVSLCSHDAGVIKSLVRFCPPTMRFVEIVTTTDVVTHPVFGKVSRIVQTPVFFDGPEEE